MKIYRICSCRMQNNLMVVHIHISTDILYTKYCVLFQIQFDSKLCLSDYRFNINICKTIFFTFQNIHGNLLWTGTNNLSINIILSLSFVFIAHHNIHIHVIMYNCTMYMLHHLLYINKSNKNCNISEHYVIPIQLREGDAQGQLLNCMSLPTKA